MAEQKTTQQYVREQYKVVENQAETVLRTWNDLVATTAALSFDTAEQSLRYNQELRAPVEHAFQEATGVYRRMYQDGLKSWQTYVQGVNAILTRENQLTK
jgi:hypothetical protein